MRNLFAKLSAAVLCAALLFCSCIERGGSEEFGGRVRLSGELRGVWISVFNIPYSLDENKFIRTFDNMMKKAEACGFNAVFVHVRSHGDAVYPSKLFPWSSYIGGKQGTAPDFDPLGIMVKLAHNHKLQFHAWINPFRVLTSDDLSALSDGNPAKKWLTDGDSSNDSRVWRRGGGIYYNPSNEAVRQLVVDGAEEILGGYDIDGLHLDDYFYPTAADEIDNAEYAAYTAAGGKLSRAEFRRSLISDMVKKLYHAVKAKDKSIAFGISPQANMSNNRNAQFADVKKWCAGEGFVDYIAPQIYFGFDYDVTVAGQPMDFAGCAQYWSETVTSPDVALYFGLGLYRSGEEADCGGAGRTEWVDNSDVVARQIEFARAVENCRGVIVFDYGSLDKNDTARREAENMSRAFATVDAPQTERGGKIALVTADAAEIMRDNCADDRSSPLCGFLPAGTVDRCAEREILNLDSGKTLRRYRRFDAGFRVYLDEKHRGGTVKVTDGELPETNAVEMISAGCGRHTSFCFRQEWNAPFTVSLLPERYKNTRGVNPDYSIERDSGEYVDIRFCYARAVSVLADIADNPLFSGYKVIGHDCLRLYLKSAGTFRGYSAEYNSRGELVISFLNPARVMPADNAYGYSLRGCVIMLDAGHGGDDAGAVGGGMCESKLNLALAKMLKEELESAGADVMLTRSGDTTLSLYERTAMIRKHRPDLFISIHRNASANTSAEGFDGFYYYPWSKRLADCCFDEIGGVFIGRSVSYHPFYVTRVTDCPSVLLENGFITNDDERRRISSDDVNRTTAKALAKGVVAYFAGGQ